MTITAMKRTTTSGIDDLLRNYKPQPLAEPPSPIVVVGEDKFGALMERYKRFLDDETQRYYMMPSTYRKITQNIHTILSSEEINQFLQMTIESETHKNYQERTGIFFSRLIQNSYNAGNNNFHLNTTALTVPLGNLCAFIKGTKKRPVEVCLKGNVAYMGWYWSKYTICILSGDAGDHFADSSENGVYTITGNIEEGVGRFSINCTYKTPNPKTLEKMKEIIPQHNKLYFINRDKTEQLVRT